MTNDDIKEKLREIKITPEQVEDKYFRETVDEMLKDRNELEDGVNELNDGAKELSDGLTELSENSGSLREAADRVYMIIPREQIPPQMVLPNLQTE